MQRCRGFLGSAGPRHFALGDENSSRKQRTATPLLQKPRLRRAKVDPNGALRVSFFFRHQREKWPPQNSIKEGPENNLMDCSIIHWNFCLDTHFVCVDVTTREREREDLNLERRVFVAASSRDWIYLETRATADKKEKERKNSFCDKDRSLSMSQLPVYKNTKRVVYSVLLNIPRRRERRCVSWRHGQTSRTM